jgi:hypothetical protein
MSVLGLAVSLGARAARGDLLNPGAFTSLGTLNLTGGSYTFNTTSDTLNGPGGTVLFTGTTYNGIAVFDFSGITISGGSITATGNFPLALLSRGDILMNGTIDVSANSAVGGPGGGAGGVMSHDIIGTGGGPGGGSSSAGGGFGGPGGFAPYLSGPPGATYGNLLVSLQGGSGGGGGGGFPFAGGGGGGGIEMGAVGNISIGGGGILANGGAGHGGHRGAANGSGGGSGGGILLHGDSVSLTSILSAKGGAGGSGFVTGDGGGGGGGRVAIVVGPGGFSGNTLDIKVDGGPPGTYNPPGMFSAAAGGAGQSIITAVPEPSSLVLLGTGVAALLGYAARRRARTRA